MKRKSMPAILPVIFGVCMVSYSGPMVKGALLAGATPASIAFARMLAAGLLLLPFAFRRNTGAFNSLPSGRIHGLWILLASVFLAAHYLAWMTSMEGTGTFASVSLVSTQPLFVALFSYFIFHEKMPRRAIPGAVIALIGALVIGLSGMLEGRPAEGISFSRNLTASLLAIVGAATMAAHWLVARHIRKTLPVYVYTPALYLSTALFLGLGAVLPGGFQMPAAALPYMAGLVLGSTLLGHALFSFAIARVSASVVSFALLGEPVGAMLFALLFIGETPAPWVIAGGGVTLAGLCLYLYHVTYATE